MTRADTSVASSRGDAGATRSPSAVGPGKKSRPQTTGEEIANSITHGLGALFGLAALIAMLYVAIVGSRSVILIISLGVYGTSLFLLYLASTLYHALAKTRAGRVFQVLDHSSIYLLIAGTYTPFCLVAVKGWQGMALFVVEWALAITGIALESVWVKRPRWATVVVYIAMGWLAIFVIQPIVSSMQPAGIVLLVAGGLAYTLGVIFYAMRRVPYMHAVWHLFVLAGSLLQFASIVLYIVPQA
jgi:hemolysin III